MRKVLGGLLIGLLLGLSLLWSFLGTILIFLNSEGPQYANDPIHGFSWRYFAFNVAIALPGYLGVYFTHVLDQRLSRKEISPGGFPVLPPGDDPR